MLLKTAKFLISFYSFQITFYQKHYNIIPKIIINL